MRGWEKWKHTCILKTGGYLWYGPLMVRISSISEFLEYYKIVGNNSVDIAKADVHIHTVFKGGVVLCIFFCPKKLHPFVMEREKRTTVATYENTTFQNWIKKPLLGNYEPLREQHCLIFFIIISEPILNGLISPESFYQDLLLNWSDYCWTK